MVDTGPRHGRGTGPLLLVSGVVVLVAFGQARGSWSSNLHNGLLAIAFSFVGAYVLHQRPGHREGRLFLATGVVEALLFLGRQIGHSPTPAGSRWWGWLGVWPTAVALTLTTLSVICFPDGRLPARAWRWVVAGVVAVATGCATLSALWPVEYDSAAVTTAHPLNARAPGPVSDVWTAVAHPAYVSFQVLWIAAVAVRWRAAGPAVRRQLTWLVSAAAVSLVALVVGLLVAGSPRAGLLAATLVPVAAGWAIVHGQHLAAYSALTWLSRTAPGSTDLPADLARAVADALTAPGATVWMGGDPLHAVGVWPETDDDISPTTLDDLDRSGSHHTRVISRRGTGVGVISVDRARAHPLSLAEDRLLDDLAAQAALVLDHLGLNDVVARQRRAGHLDRLTPRERDVLELMARGRTNVAICDELHLSIKTIEPVVSTIFTKLGLPADTANNRRVLAVLAFHRV